MELIRQATRTALVRTGTDLSAYKDAVLLRRLRGRARELGFQGPGPYLDWLEGEEAGTGEEVRKLVASLNVGVSGFFRDPAVFDTLERVVCPLLLAGRPAGEPLRVWSAACSRGQEAYSLAATLVRCARKCRAGVRVSVLGTDVDASALEAAATAVYPPRALAGADPDRIQETFEAPRDGCRAVRPGIRRLVHFRRGNLLDFASHPRELDLIACRNLLIYLRRSAQQELLLALHRALRPGGFLILGPSETVLGRPWARFEHVDPASRIYRKPLLRESD